MITTPRTAMLLAAGFGQRMRPLTETTAKPLLPVADIALIDRHLNMLAAAGVKRAIVNVHWHADKVEAHLASHKTMEIIVSDERDTLLETGGALAKARPLLGDDPVFIVNTDAFWGPADAEPLSRLAENFVPENMDELLLLADTCRCIGYHGRGDFSKDPAGCLQRRTGEAVSDWAYAGVRILKPELYDDQDIAPFSANRIWNQLLENQRLYGIPLDRFWLHVGDPTALRDAEMWLRCHGE
ncbi:MAG: UTP--glucose-1-phosphate uridylyltransferase [Hyphomonas sp. TMED17]|nr:MAG: UTP--glucose-1-phosphate uridylyltransferase [Hyphomonas sp. TMED17]